ncbi:hypothetical protein E2C01_009688 [Portunus trituberculatus]|uniref:Uncharacterized protein n=1 Tax=Portunus trituberculatus TaxID=210409 RepID=A0A5B7D6E6_PORTR|nr:hypothetical protein [Portunus trituberculatus]
MHSSSCRCVKVNIDSRHTTAPRSSHDRGAARPTTLSHRVQVSALWWEAADHEDEDKDDNVELDYSQELPV